MPNRPSNPIVAGDGESLTPEQMREVIAKSRRYEKTAYHTVIAAAIAGFATMTGAIATMVSNISHDRAAVSIAEAKARECRP